MPAVSTWTLLRTVRVRGGGGRLPPSRDHHVDAGAGDDEAGHANHFVHLDRDGAHALGNRRRQAGARVDRRELRLGQRLVFGDRDDNAAVDDLVDLGERARNRGRRRPGDQLEIVFGHQRADRNRMRGDDGLCACDFNLANRPALHGR